MHRKMHKMQRKFRYNARNAKHNANNAKHIEIEIMQTTCKHILQKCKKNMHNNAKMQCKYNEMRKMKNNAIIQ